jgi:hypothetical protein
MTCVSIFNNSKSLSPSTITTSTMASSVSLHTPLCETMEMQQSHEQQQQHNKSKNYTTVFNTAASGFQDIFSSHTLTSLLQNDVAFSKLLQYTSTQLTESKLIHPFHVNPRIVPPKVSFLLWMVSGYYFNISISLHLFLFLFVPFIFFFTFHTKYLLSLDQSLSSLLQFICLLLYCLYNPSIPFVGAILCTISALFVFHSSVILSFFLNNILIYHFLLPQTHYPAYLYCLSFFLLFSLSDESSKEHSETLRLRMEFAQELTSLTCTPFVCACIFFDKIFSAMRSRQTPHKVHSKAVQTRSVLIYLPETDPLATFEKSVNDFYPQKMESKSCSALDKIIYPHPYTSASSTSSCSPESTSPKEIKKDWRSKFNFLTKKEKTKTKSC